MVINVFMRNTKEVLMEVSGCSRKDVDDVARWKDYLTVAYLKVSEAVCWTVDYYHKTKKPMKSSVILS